MSTTAIALICATAAFLGVLWAAVRVNDRKEK